MNMRLSLDGSHGAGSIGIVSFCLGDLLPHAVMKQM